MRIAYDSIEELARLAASETVTIGQLVLEEQAEQLGRTKEQLLAVLDEDLTVMEQAARRGGRKDVRSHSGLTGGDGWPVRPGGADAFRPAGGLRHGHCHFGGRVQRGHGPHRRQPHRGQLRHSARGGAGHDGTARRQPPAGL